MTKSKKNLPTCPDCGLRVYLVKTGELVCRNCGYDERKVNKELDQLIKHKWTGVDHET